MKIVGVKDVAGRSKGLPCDGRGPFYYELFYNTRTGKVSSFEHYDLGHNAFIVFNDAPHIVRVGIVVSPVTMKEIRQMVLRAVNNMEG